MTWDVIISGAGIIGVSLALELRQQGAQVLVLDQGDPGTEASAAAAGMLAPADPETPEELRPIADESARMYEKFVKRLETASGVNVDFRHGTITLFQQPKNLPDHRLLSTSELRELEPALDAGPHSAYCIASEARLDPHLLMQAAVQAARTAGVEIRSGKPVQSISSRGSHVEVVSAGERFHGRAAVNCQGAWAGAPVRPRKGQMFYLQPKNQSLLKHAVRAPQVYMVPRSSGKILVGATVEDIGFDKTVASETIQRLHRAAAEIVPELTSAPIVASWAGLRPGTPDDLPILGRTETSNVFVATGHFRNGILLAPITARIMAKLIAGQDAGIDISSFSPARFVGDLQVRA